MTCRNLLPNHKSSNQYSLRPHYLCIYKSKFKRFGVFQKRFALRSPCESLLLAAVSVWLSVRVVTSHFPESTQIIISVLHS